MARIISTRAWLVLLILILVACIANLVAAVLLSFPASGPGSRVRGGKPTIARGADAAARGWPAATPHPLPWPAPSDWDGLSAPGRRFINAMALDDEDPKLHFQMQASQSGWPFPVIQDVQRWWPWDHPTWKLSGISQAAGLSFVWTGLLLNPLIVAVPPWLIVVVPLAGWRYLTRLRRLAARQCVACGYPVGESDRCTECGAMLTPRPTS